MPTCILFNNNKLCAEWKVAKPWNGEDDIPILPIHLNYEFTKSQEWSNILRYKPLLNINIEEGFGQRFDPYLLLIDPWLRWIYVGSFEIYNVSTIFKILFRQ